MRNRTKKIHRRSPMDFFLQDLFQISFQGILPCWKWLEAIFYKLGFIQAAVEWTYSLGNAVLCSCDRRYLYFFVFLVAEGSSLAEDLFSEIIPADEAAFVGCLRDQGCGILHCRGYHLWKSTGTGIFHPGKPGPDRCCSCHRSRSDHTIKPCSKKNRIKKIAVTAAVICGNNIKIKR